MAIALSKLAARAFVLSLGVWPALASTFGGTEDFNLFGKQLNFCPVVGPGGVCAAVAAINSFIFLENRYPSRYGNLLTPKVRARCRIRPI